MFGGNLTLAGKDASGDTALLHPWLKHLGTQLADNPENIHMLLGLSQQKWNDTKTLQELFVFPSLNSSTALFWNWHFKPFKIRFSFFFSLSFSDSFPGSILSYNSWKRKWWGEMLNKQLEAQGMWKQIKCYCIKCIFSDPPWGEDWAPREG